ncbi:hypothetical protein Tdes44962_MAKER09205 [Teratosphaeria destructans]|uniref:Uncharacterized protein n=1 Tax=Teratosphaeria destructans TaxID=418781 RepID=A0A9W7SUA0_9PEZI|nr:hypothetical protein Tdes44962_MAKER09205 [Teratosphaeria destructans]
MEVDAVDDAELLPTRPFGEKQQRMKCRERDDRGPTPVWAPKYGSKPADKNWVRNHKRRPTAAEHGRTA